MRNEKQTCLSGFLIGISFVTGTCWLIGFLTNINTELLHKIEISYSVSIVVWVIINVINNTRYKWIIPYDGYCFYNSVFYGIIIGIVLILSLVTFYVFNY